jgi:hypothetical protein
MQPAMNTIGVVSGANEDVNPLPSTCARLVAYAEEIAAELILQPSLDSVSPPLTDRSLALGSKI